METTDQPQTHGENNELQKLWTKRFCGSDHYIPWATTVPRRTSNDIIAGKNKSIQGIRKIEYF